MPKFISNLYNRIVKPTDENIDAMIYGNEQEKIDVPIKERMANIGQNLGNALIGKPIYEMVGNDDKGNPIYSSDMRRTGGIVNDLTSGYRENANTRFSPDNWTNERKSAAKRIGEVLGTGARLLDSPAGRMLLAYGASNMLGDTNPLEQAFTAGLTNMNARANDRIFRNDLLETQKQALINSPEFNALSDAEKARAIEGLKKDATDEQKQSAYNSYLANRQQNALRGLEDNINGLRGYITPETYRMLNQSNQIRDNYAWRKASLDSQNRQNEIMNQMRQDQFEETKAQNAFNRMLAGQKLSLDERQLALGYAKLEADKMGEYAKMLEKEQEKANEYKDVENQLKAFEGTFKEANNPYRYRMAGGVSNMFNTLSPAENNFNAQRTLLFNQIARKLGGEKGVLSDQDIKRVEAALPSLSDTFEQKQAKMKAIYNLLDIKKGGTGNTQNVGKYKVTVKG